MRSSEMRAAMAARYVNVKIGHDCNLLARWYLTEVIDGISHFRHPPSRNLGILDRRVVLRSPAQCLLQHGAPLSLDVSAGISFRSLPGKFDGQTKQSNQSVSPYIGAVFATINLMLYMVLFWLFFCYLHYKRGKQSYFNWRYLDRGVWLRLFSYSLVLPS